MLYWALEGDERLSYLRETIDRRLDQLIWSIRAYTSRSDASRERKLGWTEKQLQLIELIYDDNKFGEKNDLLARIFGERLAVLHAEFGDEEQALSNIEKAAACAVAYAQLPKQFIESTPLLAGLRRDKSKNETADARNHCRILLEDYFPLPCFDFVRGDPGFQKAEAMLKQYLS